MSIGHTRTELDYGAAFSDAGRLDGLAFEVTGISSTGPGGGLVEPVTATPVVGRHYGMVVPLMKCARVLEVGTGTGVLSGFLAKTGVPVTSLDLSQPVLNVAAGFWDLLGVKVPSSPLSTAGKKRPITLTGSCSRSQA